MAFVIALTLVHASTVLIAQDSLVSLPPTTNPKTVDQLLGQVSAPLILPQPRTSPAASSVGFQCSIIASCPSCAGVISVEIQITTPAALPADRNLVIRFRPTQGNILPADLALQANVEISLKQGVRQHKHLCYLTNWAAMRTLNVQIFEEGKPLKAYEGQITFPQVAQAASASQVFHQQFESEFRHDCLLVVHPDASSTQPLSPNDLSLLRSTGSRRTASNVKTPRAWISKAESNLFKACTDLVAFGNNMTWLSLASVREMPTDWRAYQAYDWVVVHQDTLQEWKQHHPQSLSVLRHWVMLGGTLVVQSSGPSETNDPPNSRWSTVDHVTEAIGASPVLQGMDASLKRSIEFTQSAWRTKMAIGEPSNHRTRSPTKASKRASKIPANQWRKRIRVTRLGGGLVALLTPQAGDREQQLDMFSLNIMMHTSIARCSPMLRRGVDPLLGDTGFRRFLVPGVAEPPVYTFLGILTVFVILVGPIAYRQTSLAHRSHWMFIIAPSLAVITSLALLAYGLVSDGLGTVTRLRQITIVDAASEDAVQRCRSSYFAGIRPSGNLDFPKFAEVMRYPNPTNDLIESMGKREMSTLATLRITSSSQSFSNSLIPSRTITQFVTHRPIPNLGHLLVQEIDGSKNAKRNSPTPPMQVTNHFPFPLRRLIIRDTDGSYWLIPEMESEETIAAEPQTQKKASMALGRLYNDYRTLMPSSSPRRPLRTYAGTPCLTSVLAETLGLPADDRQGTLESSLRKMLQLNAALPVGHFIAISDPDVEDLAVTDSELVASVRYVMGTFRRSTSAVRPEAP